jgi:hypothetical protein
MIMSGHFSIGINLQKEYERFEWQEMLVFTYSLALQMDCLAIVLGGRHI